MINEQTSLESNFSEQDASIANKFVLTEILKRCSVCGKLKPKSKFNKEKSGKGGLRSKCKDCQSKYIKKYNEEHRDEKAAYDVRYYKEHNMKEQNFLWRSDKRKVSGYYNGQGICLICGELHPLVLQNHHVLPREDMVVSLCSNCHKLYYAGKSRDKHMIAILNAIENSKFLWDSDGQPKGLKPVPMWTADLSLKEAIVILKSYDLPGYEPVGIEV